MLGHLFWMGTLLPAGMWHLHQGCWAGCKRPLECQGVLGQKLLLQLGQQEGQAGVMGEALDTHQEEEFITPV